MFTTIMMMKILENMYYRSTPQEILFVSSHCRITIHQQIVLMIQIPIIKVR